MKLKAKYDLVLPNGEKVKLGDIFEYDGDVGAFETVVDVVKEVNLEQDIRERAKELGIRNYHVKKIETLKAEVEEREAVLVDETPNSPDADPTPASASEGEGAPAREEEEIPEGEQNV